MTDTTYIDSIATSFEAEWNRRYEETPDNQPFQVTDVVDEHVAVLAYIVGAAVCSGGTRENVQGMVIAKLMAAIDCNLEIQLAAPKSKKEIN